MWLLVLDTWDSPKQGSVVEAVIDIADTGDYDKSRLEMALPYGSAERLPLTKALLLFPELLAINRGVLE